MWSAFAHLFRLYPAVAGRSVRIFRAAPPFCDSRRTDACRQSSDLQAAMSGRSPPPPPLADLVCVAIRRLMCTLEPARAPANSSDLGRGVFAADFSRSFGAIVVGGHQRTAIADTALRNGPCLIRRQATQQAASPPYAILAPTTKCMVDSVPLTLSSRPTSLGGSSSVSTGFLPSFTSSDGISGLTVLGL